MSPTRRLAAILAADVAGYSRLIEADEEGTLGRLKGLRAEIIDPKIAGHKGRIVKTTGDGLLVEFASVVDAVRCAGEMQAALAGNNAPLPPNRRIDFRIGINAGDIVVEDGDIFGDSVNIAARLEGLAEPGGICVSARVREDAAGRLDLAFEDIGEQALKNITRPVRVFRVRSPLPNPSPARGGGKGGGAAIAGQAVDRGAAVRQSIRGPRAGVFRRRHGRGDYHRPLAHPLAIRDARNSSFTYKGQSVNVKQVGRELGVRYMLEGSVRKAGGRVRITAQLIDAQNGAHLWAERFDALLEDVFELQDKVAISVSGVIEPALQPAETARSAHRPTNDLNAYDLYLRAYAMILASARQVPDALRLLERAITRDARFGAALAEAAFCSHRLVIDGLSENPVEDRLKGIDFARRALEVAAGDPHALATAAHALAYFGEDIDAMIALVDRALALNPSFARGWQLSGTMRLWAGQPDISIQHTEASVRLSPRARVGSSLAVIGHAHFFSRRFNEAVPKLLLAVQEDPSNIRACRCLAACYAQMGRLGEAREFVARVRPITSVVVPDLSFYRNPEHRELFLSGLRLAAGET